MTIGHDFDTRQREAAQQDFDDFLDSCNDEFGAAVIKGPKQPKRYPCGQCAGTGLWSGGTNRHGNRNCIACKGKGYFVTPPEYRLNQRKKAAAKRQSNREQRMADMEQKAPGILDFLKDAARWSDFARALLTSVDQYGHLTDNQLRAASNMRAKTEARAKARDDAAPKIDLAPIKAMFDSAVESGYKRPTYRAEGLKISRAPDTGRNPGALYVVDLDSSDYLGKVLGLRYRGKDSALPGLAAIAADPSGAAVRYGQRTGTCACCGRRLTNHKSIEAGIGPICAARWGL